MNLKQNRYLKPYYNKLDAYSRYIGCNMAGGYEIRFLPFSGGIDEQPHIWYDTIFKITNALNSMK